MNKEYLKTIFHNKTLKEIVLNTKDYKEDNDLVRVVDYHGEKIINDYIFHEEYGIFDVALFRELVFVFKDKEIVKVINVYEADSAKIIPFNNSLVVSGHKSYAIYSFKTEEYMTWFSN